MLHLFPHAVRPTLAESPLWRDPMSEEAYAIRKGLTDAEKGKTLTRPPRTHDDTDNRGGGEGAGEGPGAGTGTGAGTGAGTGHMTQQPAHTQAYGQHTAVPHYQQSTSVFQYSTEPHRTHPANPAYPAGSMPMPMGGQGQGQGQHHYRVPTSTSNPYTQSASSSYMAMQPPRPYMEGNSQYTKTAVGSIGSTGYHAVQGRPDARPSSSSSSSPSAEAQRDVGDPLQYMS